MRIIILIIFFFMTAPTLGQSDEPAPGGTEYLPIPKWVTKEDTSKSFTMRELVDHMPAEAQTVKKGSVKVDTRHGRISGDPEDGWEFTPHKGTLGSVPIHYENSSGESFVGAYIEVESGLTGLTGSVCYKTWICNAVAGGALVLAAGLILFGRYYWVVEPKNAHLRAQHRVLWARLDSNKTFSGDSEKAKAIQTLLNAVVNDGPQERGLIPSENEKPRLRMLFAFTGKQLAAWRLLHEAERLVFEGNPDPVVQGQAIVALSRLDRLADPPRKLRRELTKTLQRMAEMPKDLPADKQPLVALLKEAKALIFDAEDRLFETAATAQNKAFWLVGAAFFSVLAVGLSFKGAPVLLLAGAVGGLLARLRKAIKQQTTVFDYGVSWGVLFLTPFTGALSGWIGVALLAILQQWGFIDERMLNIDLFDANIFTAIAALIFGLSATLFDKFVEKFEAAVTLAEKPALPENDTEIMAAEEETEKVKTEIEKLKKTEAKKAKT